MKKDTEVCHIRPPTRRSNISGVLRLSGIEPRLELAVIFLCST